MTMRFGFSSASRATTVFPKPVLGGSASTKSGDDSEDTAEPATKKPQPTLYDSGNVHIVRAVALGKDDIIGDFEAELLKVATNDELYSLPRRGVP